MAIAERIAIMLMICSAEFLILDSHAYTLFAPVAILAQTKQLPPDAVSPSIREDEKLGLDAV